MSPCAYQFSLKFGPTSVARLEPTRTVDLPLISKLLKKAAIAA